jgi:hypothetical protein
VLRDWDDLVEFPLPEANERLTRLLNEGAVRPERLVRASATEPPGVRERLRRLLHDLNRDELAARVRPARRELSLAG